MLEDVASLVSLVLRVRDIDAAADWYRHHLGVDVATGADGRHRIASFQLAGTVLSLWELQPEDAGPRGSTSDPYPVVVVSGGIEQIHAELREAGVEVDSIVASENFRLFRFHDLDGNVFEVSQLVG